MASPDAGGMRSERLTIETPDDGKVELHWIEHGDPAAAQTVVCVHGLTRNGHDGPIDNCHCGRPKDRLSP